MTRLSKQQRKRRQYPKKHRPPSVKTGPKKEPAPKEHFNALGTEEQNAFIPRIR